ncbi:hypothetical protein FE257_003873 [Aspergillus nanangensis]|uniref:Thioesterase domain-containing protein n=1 Tax=Aspergillus nanangensis TaxID=2582783 RepID=A0AAD4CB42_ASPNN|nr:hypothetical protein FE257_003873 [Aspergillus nanangensis]
MEAPLPISASEYPPFYAHPHAHRLLHDPAYYPIRTWSRLPKPSTGEDGFFSGTVATPNTISHVLTLRRRNLLSRHEIVSSSPPSWPPPTADPLTSSPSMDPPDIVILWHLVPPGISGHPSTAHGGIVAACIDETMSLAVALYLPQRDLDDDVDGLSVEGFRAPRPGLYTSQLDIRYKQPNLVPGVMIIRAKVVGHVGRKFWTRAHVLQTDQQNPDQLNVTTDAMGFWLQTGASL